MVTPRYTLGLTEDEPEMPLHTYINIIIVVAVTAQELKHSLHTYINIIIVVAVTAQELKHSLKHTTSTTAALEPRGAVKAQNKIFRGRGNLRILFGEA